MFSIGAFREARAPDMTGEHEAWEALYDALADRGFSKAILETSGLNGRLRRIEDAIPEEEFLRVKLVCPPAILHERVRERDSGGDGSAWAYISIPDRHAFIDRFQEAFGELDADIVVDTSSHGPAEVLDIVERELDTIADRPGSRGPC